ncbi:hypothetical protein [Streptomyces sp. BBFR102]|uniref:hypothetical protein n=1 Tax=Streptomyces sp. BBFR102 TaxID=3448171 RepID=UPI003F530818
MCSTAWWKKRTPENVCDAPFGDGGAEAGLLRRKALLAVVDAYAVPEVLAPVVHEYGWCW